jgi:colanic acid/amylovoran biosynthesis glycosyltransferase
VPQARTHAPHAHFTRPAADTAILVCQLGRRAERAKGWTWSFSAHGADIYDTDPVALSAKVRHASTVVCVSDYGHRHLTTLVDKPHWSKLRVVRCGIDVGRYRPIDRPGSCDSLRILAVGRLVPVKGHAVLLEALARLMRSGIDAELTIVGDGPLRPSLEALARDLQLAPRVHFAGRVGQDDIMLFYADADVFALSSMAEGIPVVLMEAMAAQLPVVAPRIHGIPELVEDGRHGLLVGRGRSDELAEALAMLARDPKRRAQMGRAGRERIAERFELRQSAVELRAILEQLVAIPPQEDALLSDTGTASSASPS